MKCYTTENLNFESSLSLNHLIDYVLDYEEHTFKEMIKMQQLQNYVFFPMTRKEKWFSVINFRNAGFKVLFLMPEDFKFYKEQLKDVNR